MRIGVDSRPLREKQTSGIPMYVRSLLTELAKIDHHNEYVLYAHKDFNFSMPNSRWSKRYGAKTMYGSVWMQAELPLWLKQDGIDLFWGTQHILPLYMPKQVKAVLTVHDLVHYVFPKTMRFVNLMINKFIIPPSVHRTDAIVAISNWTLKDVQSFLNPKGKLMSVNPLGVSDRFYPRDKEGARRKLAGQFELKKPFLLTVGTFEPRKNMLRTIRAFTSIAHKIPHDLAMIGQSGWKNQDVHQELLNNPVKDRIRFLGYIEDELIPEFYSAADAFIFPSLYEGFGLPPLEAMACAVPVVASNVSSIPEILGDAAYLVSPHSQDEIAEGMLRVATDQILREKLVHRGVERASTYTWQNTAKRMLELFSAFERKQ